MTIMESILSLDKLYLFLGIFLAVCILVIAAIMLDLWDGVHTAKKTNQRVHSHKLRVTIAKMSEYWRFILIGFLVDCLGIFFSFYRNAICRGAVRCRTDCSRGEKYV